MGIRGGQGDHRRYVGGVKQPLANTSRPLPGVLFLHVVANAGIKPLIALQGDLCKYQDARKFYPVFILPTLVWFLFSQLSLFRWRSHTSAIHVLRLKYGRIFLA